MCGYCFESLALDLTESHDPEWAEIDITIEETPNPQDAVALAIGKERTLLPSLIARLAGTIARDPNASIEFRQILNSALEMGTPAVTMPPVYLHWLSGGHVTDIDMLGTARIQIKDFSDWWFGGQVLQRDVTLDKGRWDSINSIAKVDLERLYAVTPAIMMSLGFIRRLGVDELSSPRLLLDLVSGKIPGTPCFEGMDLWIQRAAILDYYDLFGDSGLLRRIKDIRPFLWAYLLVQRNLSLDTQNQLILVLGSDWMDDENL